jgi:hypothetical protein
MIVPPKIIVLSSDQKNRNGSTISNEFILFGHKYILIGAMYNQNQEHFITIIKTNLNDKYTYYKYDGMIQNGEYRKLTYQNLYSKIDENKLIVMTIYVLSNDVTNNVTNNAITNTNDTSNVINNVISNDNNNTNNNAITIDNNNDTSTIDNQKYKNCIECINDSTMKKCRIDLKHGLYMELYKIISITSNRDLFSFEYYVKQEIFFKIIVVIQPNEKYSLEIACDKDNSQIKTWNAGDMRFKLLKTFFIEIRKFLYYLKITTKLKENYLYSTKKEMLFSIERNSKFDTTIENELFIKFLDIGFHSKKDRHYKCLLFF